ncbi:murein biosynthesis integral membrane protein MurJ [Tolumonas lignilytica]|uniref:murein biosynthesis integral membrane protein MurJ n=1 Tax=Tolumonas lignilytica TaxID=1283284 RepID=UPI000467B520|nr:murein biosynthesis integral membrane protein MurJ [Tolumonas lignilytica]
MSKKLIKSGLMVTTATFASRILGLVRDIAIAHLLGAGIASDVFFFANRIPNYLRRLFADGAFNQAFVPVMTEYREMGDKTAVRELLSAASGTLGLIITIVTVLGVLGSTVLSALFGWGWFMAWWHNEPGAEKFELASLLLKITFPYLWFVTFTAMSGAVLNTYGRFGVSSFTPTFLNVSLIATAWWIAPHTGKPEIALAVGTFVGGFIQLIYQIPYLYKMRFLVKPKWAWHHPGVTKIRSLMLPAIFGVSVSQINLMFNTMLASFLATGSISYLYYSDRLLEFPLGMFAVAISTVILPSLAKRHVDADPLRFSQTMDWGVRMVLFLGLPAMVGIMVLREPILRVLFMRGEFGAHEVQMAGGSLLASTSGLLSLMLARVLAPGFHARQDTKTPVRYGMHSMAANMIFNAILIYPLGYIGLALSTALSGTVNAISLFQGLYRRQIYRPGKETVIFLIRLAMATLLMGGVLVWLCAPLSSWTAWSQWRSVLELSKLIGIALVAYGLGMGLVGLRPRHFKTVTEG